MRIIGYTYCADVHCPRCTRLAVAAKQLKLDHKHPHAIGIANALDSQSVPLDMVDREGNLVHPVFDTDEASESLTHCGDCHEELQ